MIPETQSPLSRFIEPLKSLDHVVAHLPVSDDNDIERLFIDMDIEGQPEARKFVLEIFFVNDAEDVVPVVIDSGVDEGEDDDSIEDDEADSIFTQFSLVLPVVAPKGRELEILRFIGSVNQLVPIGAFGHSGPDEAIYFRYTLATESRLFSEGLIIEVVSAIEYICGEYAGRFEQVCEGLLTAKQFIEELSEPSR